MLTIIHGSDTATSRKYFLEQKQSTPEALLLDADKINLTDLAQIFQGGGLFSETKHLFVEQLLTKRKKSIDFKDILTYLQKQASDHTIFLWEGKELETSSLKAVKNPLVKAFKLPQTLFLLLDALKPGNGPTLVKLFQQTIETTEVEMVFFMLVRQCRLLLALHSNQMSLQGTKQSPESQIDELKRMQPWQKSKLQKQAGLFETKHLLTLYHKLFVLEKQQKTGILSAPMTTTIDFLLLEI